MSKLDVIDVVDMLEKKYSFTREDAKMLINFNSARLATKDDLNLLNANIATHFSEIEGKIDSVEQKLENKMEKEINSVRSDLKNETSSLKEEMGKNHRSQLMWMFGMFVGIILITLGLIR